MIDIELLRKNPEEVITRLGTRGVPKKDVESLIQEDTRWREKETEYERLKAHRDELMQERSLYIPRDEEKRLTTQIDEITKRLRDYSKERENLKSLKETRDRLWKHLPNLPLPDVPVGSDASANREVTGISRPRPTFDFPPLDHVELGGRLGLLDVQRATTASGSRFGALLGNGVRLEFALVNHAFDVLAEEGFQPVIPPALIRRDRMEAMGYLDRGAEEVYATQDDLVLVGTSEQSVGAMYAGHRFAHGELPARFVAFSSCFRREAGSHGKDVRGIIRLHQFDKVEMFSFCRPENSIKEHGLFLELQKRLMNDLEIPFRVVQLCTGDLGLAAAATTDIEAWFPSRDAFVETHSTSNTTDFQTRRLPVKFRGDNGGLHFAHAINGTAYAIQRTIAALLETHQTQSSKVTIPAVLRPYFGGQETF
ncbi:MAG: serine--tRNA ligase [bacterium]|nr:serine--tRNA ligase [bacterium]